MREGAPVRVEHPLDAQLLLGGDRLARARVRRARAPGSARRPRPGRRRRARARPRPVISRSSRSPTRRTSCGGGRPSLKRPTPPTRACCSNSRRYSGLPPVAARARATASTDPGRAENPLDAVARCRPPRAAPAPAAQRRARRPARHAADPVPPAERRRRARAELRARRAAMPQQAESHLVSPLAVIEEQRERPIVGQLDDQPPQRVARPHRRASSDHSDPPTRRRAPVAQPRRPVGRAGRAPRAPTARERRRAGRSPRSRQRSRRGHGLPPPRARAVASRSNRVFPDPGLTLDQHRAATPGGRRLDDIAEHRSSSLARSAHPRLHSPPLHAGRQPGANEYRGRYRADARRGRRHGRRSWRQSPKGVP